MAPDGSIINDVAFAHGRYVAVGGEFDWGGYFNYTAMVWLSADGEHWARAPDASRLAQIYEDFGAVAAGGPGFIATTPTRGVWTSPDGDVWTLLTAPQAASEGWITDDVVVGPDGRIVLAGGPGVIRVTHDGGWTVRQLVGTLGPNGSTTLTSTSWGYAALYVSLDMTGTSEAPLWISRDALTWVRPEMDISPPLGVSAASAGLPALLSTGDALIVSNFGNTWVLPGGGGPRGE